MVMRWNYYLPTRIFLGSGILNNLPDYLKLLDTTRNILLVTGRKAMKELGYTDKVLRLLKDYQVFIFDQIDPNPDIKLVKNALLYAKENDIDLVIGLGGGSVIDVAKSVAILTNNDKPLEEYLPSKGKIQRRGLNFIAIPTTAGTGSEVTRWATIWDKEKKEKKSLEHSFMYPTMALIDPTITVHLDKYITAVTGLDTLSHAIEAYWSNNSQPLSDIFAKDAIRLIFGNLERAYQDPSELKFRENMSKASLFAGLAFSNTKTTAAHSISYPMTAYFNIPHGLACAITLPSLLEFNAEVVREKSLAIAKLTGAKTVSEGAENIRKLVEKLNLPTSLSGLGIREKDLDIIIENGFTPDRVKNNPREITRDDLYKILKNLL